MTPITSLRNQVVATGYKFFYCPYNKAPYTNPKSPYRTVYTAPNRRFPYPYAYPLPKQYPCPCTTPAIDSLLLDDIGSTNFYVSLPKPGGGDITRPGPQPMMIPVAVWVMARKPRGSSRTSDTWLPGKQMVSANPAAGERSPGVIQKTAPVKDNGPG